MNFKSSKIIPLIIITLLFMAACSSPQNETATPQEEIPQPTEVAMTEIPAKKGVTIHYMGRSQFELTDTQGTRVLIDIFTPSYLSAPAGDNDILLTSNPLNAAYVDKFVDSFVGQQLFIKEGQIKTDHVTITSVASGYTPVQLDRPAEGGSNYIFVIEMEGLRIAHLGGIGQEEFSPEQLEVLGDIDIALMQFDNGYSQINAGNKIGYNLMSQLQPKMIIPTYGSGKMQVVELANEYWDSFVVLSDIVTISTDDIPDETVFLIMGSNAEPMKTIFELPTWEQ